MFGSRKRLAGEENLDCSSSERSKIINEDQVNGDVTECVNCIEVSKD